MNLYLRQWTAVALACLLMAITVFPAAAQSNCRTALGRIAKTEALRAIERNRETACSGFRLGPAAIDKTRALELTDFEFCESGPVVTARLSVRVECATSDRAVFRQRVSDTLSAQASANLDSCTVSEARVWASGFLTQVALDWANANQRLADAVARAIRPYCVPQ